MDPTPREQNLSDTLAVDRVVLDALAARAAAARSQLDGARCWLAIAQHVRRHRRRLGWAAEWTWSGPVTQQLICDQLAFLAVQDQIAGRHLEAIDSVTRGRAHRGLGIRLAVAGKGGVGKTTISATLARVLAGAGRDVLVVDFDPNQGINMNLGLGPVAEGLPAEAIEEHPGSNYGWRLASGLDPREVVERFSARCPGGVHYLGIGKIGGNLERRQRRSITALQQVLRAFADPGWDVIVDLEAGTTGPFQYYHDFVDTVLLIVGPSWRSGLTVRRLQPLLQGIDSHVIANRFRGEKDHDGLVPMARIPHDPWVADAERQGVALIDLRPCSAAVEAISALADHLLSTEVHAAQRSTHF